MFTLTLLQQGCRLTGGCSTSSIIDRARRGCVARGSMLNQRPGPRIKPYTDQTQCDKRRIEIEVLCPGKLFDNPTARTRNEVAEPGNKHYVRCEHYHKTEGRIQTDETCPVENQQRRNRQFDERYAPRHRRGVVGEHGRLTELNVELLKVHELCSRCVYKQHDERKNDDFDGDPAHHRVNQMYRGGKENLFTTVQTGPNKGEDIGEQMLTHATFSFYATEGLRGNAQVRGDVFLAYILFNAWEHASQLLISLKGGKVLEIAGSFPAGFIILDHHGGIDFERFGEPAKQFLHGIVGDTAQPCVGLELDELVGRNLVKETPDGYYYLAGRPEPLDLLFSVKERVGHGKTFIQEVGTFGDTHGFEQMVIGRKRERRDSFFHGLAEFATHGVDRRKYREKRVVVHEMRRCNILSVTDNLMPSPLIDSGKRGNYLCPGKEKFLMLLTAQVFLQFRWLIVRCGEART